MTLSERDDVDPDAGASREPSLLEAGVAALLGRLDPRSPLRSADLVPVTAEDTPAYAEFATFGLAKYAEIKPADWAQRKVAELLPVPMALGDYLEHLPPGPRLAHLLDVIDTADVDDYSLVEVVAAYRRMESWAAARTGRAAAALSERPALNPTWPGTVPGRGRGECVVGEELAMRLRVSRQTALRIVSSGRGFGKLFQLTGEALEQGQIDYPRAQAIVRALEDLPTDVAMAAQWEVIDKAPGRTLRQLQNDLARAVIAVDPDDADERHRRARQKRCVYRPRPLPDGMAQMTAVVPAADAIALDLALDAAARSAKQDGDKRTLDQLRADALGLMAYTALECGHIGPDAALRVCACGVVAEPPPAESAGSAPPPTAAPLDEAPTAPPPHAPPSVGTSTAPPPTVSPPPEATIAPPPTASPPGADDAAPTPDASPPGGASTTTSPTASPPGIGSTAPQRDASPGSLTAPAPTPVTPPRPVTACPPYPGHRLPGGLLPTVRLGSLSGSKVQVRVTVPLGVFLPEPGEQSPLERITEPVAELEGYGPVPPVVARALAAGGVWRRLVTDPATEQVIDVGRTRYQPPAAMAELVRERDRTCSRPGCSCSARHAEIDHEHEWQHGGVTSVENTGPNCRRDHLVKTIGAYTVAHGTDRTYAWAGPTGHGYLRRPDGTVVTMPRRSAEGLRELGRASVSARRSIDPAFVDGVLAEIAAGTDVGGSWMPSGGLRTTAPWPGVDDGPSWAAEDEPPF